MKIASVRIENFRSFNDETISFNDYVCLVGPNGAGKSTVLTALNLFFRESENTPTDLGRLIEEDFHLKNTDAPIRITVTFTDLDEEAQNDFKDYYRQGKLVVSSIATYDANTGKAEVKQYGNRSGIREFARFFELESNRAKVAELREAYNHLRDNWPGLPQTTTKTAMEQALQDYEAEHQDQCELIQSEDQFYGFSKGANRLAKHVQWIYVPAVKDPTGEQVEAKNSALGKLLARTVRTETQLGETVDDLRQQMRGRYQDMLEQEQHSLDSISEKIQSRISEWAHPGARLKLQWGQDPDKSVRVEEPWAHIVAGEDDFDGELARFGHGFQRSFLLALLQMLAETDLDNAPTLILSCEEPELYQHPPQIRHLASVLQQLSNDNAQVFVTTHNPVFVSGLGFEDIRMVRKDSETSSSHVAHMSIEEMSQAIKATTGMQSLSSQGTLAKIHQALQTSLGEMFFTQRLILVEGMEDAAYLTTYFNLLELSNDYRHMGCHIVPANGKSELIRALVIAQHMGISTYMIFDADADKEDRGGSREKHRKDNNSLLNLLHEKTAEPMPEETVWGKGFTMWKSDIGTVVKEEIGEDWLKFHDIASKAYGAQKHGSKNILHVGATLAAAWDAGQHSHSLKRLCREILNLDNKVESP